MKHLPELACETPDDPRNPPTLLCPRCGGGNLHHYNIMIYARPREDGIVTRIWVGTEGDINSERGNGRGNPSTRRHGLVIDFSCESCQQSSLLTIAQHKGTTEVMWQEGPR